MQTRQVIRQPWLTIIRILWVVLALYNLLPGLLGIPSYYQQLASLDPGPNMAGWIQENFSAVVSQSSIRPEVIAWLILVPNIFKLAVFLSIGLLIFWRKSKNWIGLLSSFVLVSLCGTFMGDRFQFLDSLPRFWQVIGYEAGTLIWLAFFMFLILFPDGHFSPSWTRWVGLSVISWFILTEGFNLATGQTPDWAVNLGFPILFIILFGIYYRYRKLSNVTEQQQIRWFVYAITVFVILGLGQYIFEEFYPHPSHPGTTDLFMYLIGIYISAAVFLFIPISIGIAIFRYHLWDIDLLIRRTLVYTVLTLIILLVYFGLILLTQVLFTGLSGQTSPLALVISTLVIAALINPLRKRIQSNIDRRFFRNRYNAELALAHFGLVMRNEVSLESLVQHILLTGQETMQPETISLWLRSKKVRP